ncbi:aldose 1-epimerase [Steroidobacter agaridevorans]|uniref:Aldose 1-epimerase n=1 Tax=Steroidobacter agaridevorans TaxID=2695856 RepID=A0A829Y8Y2_9GAMM|nr:MULTISPECIES: aldose epimerase family protein [Steroidobacteraceae]GFE79216.1 aldose 1-epimerase [Steroidobacter agaridevorans]GFE87257.1 aldose 1-epimerase [Steroidobacter agaridevorans]
MHHVEQMRWGQLGARSVYQIAVTNANGLVLKMTNCGARITALLVPDRGGGLDDVVLGFDHLAQYLESDPYFGATIGRVANRIRSARFMIDRNIFLLTANDGEHALHGGGEFATAVWDVDVVKQARATELRFAYCSADGSHGFPGNLRCHVTYTLGDDNAIGIRFEAETDRATHVNMTHHGYFNLNGGRSPIYDHRVRIDARRYLKLDGAGAATGEIGRLRGAPWDLSRSTRLGDCIHRIPLRGYHHNYIFSRTARALRHVAEVIEPDSGRILDVATTQPGIVFYAANGFTGELVGKGGTIYSRHAGLCLETQHHTDACNFAQFPSTLLRPGERYCEHVRYSFRLLPA